MLRWESAEGLRREARGSEMWFKVTGGDTDGRFSLMERTLPAGGRMPPPHRHVGNDEAYFVLDGLVEFRIGSEVSTGGAGVFYLVSANEAHTFGNTINASTTSGCRRVVAAAAGAAVAEIVEVLRLCLSIVVAGLVVVLVLPAALVGVRRVGQDVPGPQTASYRAGRSH